MAQYRDHLIDQGADGLISWEDIARRALGYMSEADCEDLANCEWDINLDESEETDEYSSDIELADLATEYARSGWSVEIWSI